MFKSICFNPRFSLLWSLLLSHSATSVRIERESQTPSIRNGFNLQGNQNHDLGLFGAWFKDENEDKGEKVDKVRTGGSFLEDVEILQNFFRKSKATPTFKRDQELSLKSKASEMPKRDVPPSQLKQINFVSTPSTSPSSFPSSSSPSWTLTERYQGLNFFTEFDFFDEADPTHGMVSYQTLESSVAKKLAFVDESGDMNIKVDNTTVLEAGGFRDSVRLESKRSFAEGLIILDVKTMPFSRTRCSGVWPAFWTFGKGAGWPQGGEIDILESIEDQAFDQSTLHTSQGCTITPSSPSNPFTGTVLATDCYAYANQNSGCGIVSNQQGSYGSLLSSSGGGLFVTRFDHETGVTIWFFPRDSIPSDLLGNSKPNPATSEWGVPQAKWSPSSCDYNTFIKNQTIVIDTTLMGDWAGSNFNNNVKEGKCQGTQAETVANPRNYDDASWRIRKIEVWNLEK